MDHIVELIRRASKVTIGGVMDVIDWKVLKGKLDAMNEMKLFRN